MFITLLLSVITATYYVLLRLLGPVASPFLLGTAFRIVCLLLFVAAFLIGGHSNLLFSRDVRRLFPWLLLIAGCNFLLESATIIGLRLTTALNAAVLGRIDIMFAVIVGALFFHERPSRADLLGIALLTAGCAIVLNVHLGGLETHAAGDLLMTFAGLLIACNAFVIRFKLAPLHPDVIAFHNVLYSTIPFAIAAGLETRVFVSTPLNLALVGILGATAFGSYVTYYLALRTMPVWRVRTLLLIVPVLVLIAEVVFLRDPISTGQIRGVFLVVAGEAVVLICGNRSARRATLPAAASEPHTMIGGSRL